MQCLRTSLSLSLSKRSELSTFYVCDAVLGTELTLLHMTAKAYQHNRQAVVCYVYIIYRRVRFIQYNGKT